MDISGYGDYSQVKPPISFTGSAKEGCVGPPIGLVDIGISESAYLFRVALPGVHKDQSKLKCEIKRDGRVDVKGVMAGPGVVKDSLSNMYEIKVQQLCPPGTFSISFDLPGPVDPRLFSPVLRPDGILEVVVVKYKEPPTDGC